MYILRQRNSVRCSVAFVNGICAKRFLEMVGNHCHLVQHSRTVLRHSHDNTNGNSKVDIEDKTKIAKSN